MNVTSPLDQLENLTDSLFVNLENKSSFNAAHFSILKEAASKILDGPPADVYESIDSFLAEKEILKHNKLLFQLNKYLAKDLEKCSNNKRKRIGGMNSSSSNSISNEACALKLLSTCVHLQNRKKKRLLDTAATKYLPLRNTVMKSIQETNQHIINMQETRVMKEEDDVYTTRIKIQNENFKVFVETLDNVFK